MTDRTSVGPPGPPAPPDPKNWASDASADLLGGVKREALLFDLENKPIPLKPPPEGRTRPRRRVKWHAPAGLRWVALALLTVGVGFAAWYTMARPARVEPAAPARETRIRIDTKPAGATVHIDGQPRGITPLVSSLPPGRHDVRVTSGAESRDIPITVGAGEQVSQYLEFQAAPEAARLEIDSDPPGARVFVDGSAKGVAPVVVEEVEPGPHAIVVQNDVASVERQVTVAAGASLAVVVPLTPRGAPLSGWVAVSAPVEMQLFEGGQLIGSTLTDRVMVAAGRHELELVNDTLAYRALRTVVVPAGKTVRLPVEMPNGSLSVNASPWAEVWIDGKRAGETPLGNLSVPIGPHEVVFRNPQFGEQRHAVTVTLAAPARLSVNLRR